MRSLANSIGGAEVTWSRDPEPEPTPCTAEDLAVELLGDLGIFKEMVSIQLGQVHRLTFENERQKATIRTLNTEIRDFLGTDRRARSENDA